MAIWEYNQGHSGPSTVGWYKLEWVSQEVGEGGLGG